MREKENSLFLILMRQQMSREMSSLEDNRSVGTHTHTRSQGAIKPATIRRKRLEDKLN